MSKQSLTDVSGLPVLPPDWCEIGDLESSTFEPQKGWREVGVRLVHKPTKHSSECSAYQDLSSNYEFALQDLKDMVFPPDGSGKTPIGAHPKSIWEAENPERSYSQILERIKVLNGAILRYSAAKKSPDSVLKWSKEVSELLEEISFGNRFNPNGLDFFSLKTKRIGMVGYESKSFRADMDVLFGLLLGGAHVEVTQQESRMTDKEKIQTISLKLYFADEK